MYTNSMSHWNMAKIEDVNWSVFGKSVDHLVPHHVKEVLGQHFYLSDDVLKQQSEVTNDFTQTMSSKGFGTNSTTLWQEDDSYHLPIKNGSSLMLQGTQSHTSNDVFPIISDLDKTNTCSTLPLEDVSISDYYISESDNPDENRNMLYPTTETSEIESKTTCLESQQKKKDNELNSYDWARMKIFDDMLSTTISQGEIGNEDEPSWLSSNTMYCSEIASEPGFQYSNYGYDTLIANMDPHFTDANCSLDNMQAVTVNDDEPTHYTFAHCSYTDVSSKSNSPIIEKSCNERNKPVQNSKDCSLNGSGADSIKCENMQSSADNGIQISTAQMILNSNFPTHKMDSSTRYQQKKHFQGFSSYMQSSDQNSQFEFNKPMHQVPFTQITSNINFDEGTNQCTSYENVHCYDKFPDQLYSSQAIAPKKNLGTLYKEQNIPHQRKVFEKIDDTKMDDAGLQNSVMHYSSKIISCFQQVQNVMKKLDPKTKLCIRESLYRLAKSASQRKDFPTQNCSEAISESKVIQDTKTSQRSEEFMDAETSTNPIDRAVAYLLLHDPAYPYKSTRPADNARALDSKLMEFEDQALFSGCSNMETDLP